MAEPGQGTGRDAGADAIALRIEVEGAVALREGERHRISIKLSDPSAKVDVVKGEVETSLQGGELELFAPMGVLGEHVVTVHAEGPQGSADAEIRVSIQAKQWGPRVTWRNGPLAREHGAFAVDEETHRVLLIGGSGYNPQGVPLPNPNTWLFDAAKSEWTLAPLGGDTLAPAGSRRLAWVQKEHAAYLFGGYTEVSDLDELFRVDLSIDPPRVSEIPQENKPPARELHGFAYDEAGGRFVLFGGYNLNARGASLADTWTMQLRDGKAIWTKVEGAGPSARYGFSYGLDATHRRFLVWSGGQDPVPTSQVNAAKDLWALDLAKEPPTWSRVLSGEEEGTPKGRRNPCFVFEPRGGYLLVTGGTPDGRTSEAGAFALDARPGKERWRTLDREGGPSPRSSGFGFVDPVTRHVVVGFGNGASVYQDLYPFGL